MKDLKSLIEVGGFYYEVFDLKHPRDKDKQVVVLFFDDSLIDLTAEMVKLQARTCDYNCRVEFKAFARQEFERFTGREVQGILDVILDHELDLPTLEKNKVVVDKLYLHEDLV